MAIYHTRRDAERRGMHELYPDGSVQYEQVPDGSVCFYCHQPFEDGPVVQGHGADQPGAAQGTGIIYLHSQCALDLCVRLMTDIHECQILESHPTMRFLGHRRLVKSDEHGNE
jgi:hypothetical protein